MSINKKYERESAANMSDKEKKAISALWRPSHDIYKVWVRLLFYRNVNLNTNEKANVKTG